MLKRATIPEGMDQSSPMYGLFSNYNNFLDQCANGIEINDDLLMNIIKENSQTEFGKKYDFENINTIEKYKEKVPITTYDDYYDSVDRMTHGEKTY